MIFLIFSDKANLESPNLLQAEIQGAGHECYKFYELARLAKFIEKIPPKKTILINRSSGHNYLDDELDFFCELERQGYRVINSSQSLKNFRDKSKQLSLSPDIPSLVPSQSDHLSLKDLDSLPDFDQGFICKTLRGSKGLGVYHFTDRLDLIDFFNASDKLYFIQTYIPAKHEFRCFFIKDKYYFIKKEKNEHGFFNYNKKNFSRFTPPIALTKKCREIIKKSNYFYGTVDFLYYNDEYYFLEINSNPGLVSIRQLFGKKPFENFITNTLEPEKESFPGEYY